MIQVNDIDPITTQEEVLEALQGAFPRSACTLFSLRAGFGGVQRAMVSCDDGLDARKLLTTSRLNIGFISCKVKLQPSITSCYICHGIGHIAAKCWKSP